MKKDKNSAKWKQQIAKTKDKMSAKDNRGARIVGNKISFNKMCPFVVWSFRIVPRMHRLELLTTVSYAKLSSVHTLPWFSFFFCLTFLFYFESNTNH